VAFLFCEQGKHAHAVAEIILLWSRKCWWKLPVYDKKNEKSILFL